MPTYQAKLIIEVDAPSRAHASDLVAESLRPLLGEDFRDWEYLITEDGYLSPQLVTAADLHLTECGH